MEKVSAGNMFIMQQPRVIKKEPNILKNYHQLDNYETTDTNHNNKKITEQLSFIKLENIKKEVISSESSHDIDADFNLMNNVVVKSERNENETVNKSQICDSTTNDQNLGIIENVTSKTVLSNKENNEETAKENSISEKVTSDTVFNSTENGSESEDENFVLQVSHDSNGEQIINEDNCAGTDLDTSNDKRTPVKDQTNNTDIDNTTKENSITKLKMKEQSKVISRSYETRAKVKNNSSLNQTTLHHFFTKLNNGWIKMDKSLSKEKHDNDSNTKDFNQSNENDSNNKKINRNIFIVKICINCNRHKKLNNQKIESCPDCRKKIKFRCQLCNKYCDTYTGIYKHVQKHHLMNLNNFFDKVPELKKFTFLNCLKCDGTRQINDKKEMACQKCNTNMVLKCLFCSKQCEDDFDICSHIYQDHYEHLTKFTHEKKVVDRRKLDSNDILHTNKVKNKGNLKNQSNIKTSENSENSNLCSNCGKTFKMLERHINYCKKKEHWNCNYCSYTTSSKPNLQNHMIIHAKSGISNSGTSLEQSYCSKCNKVTNALKYVTKCKKCQTKLIFRCAKCSEEFSKRENLRLHLRNHQILLKCPTCSKKFSSHKSLQMHKKVCEINQGFRCSFCSYTSKVKAHILRHIMAKHAED